MSAAAAVGAVALYSRYDFAGDESTGTPPLKKDEKLTLVQKVCVHESNVMVAGTTYLLLFHPSSHHLHHVYTSPPQVQMCNGHLAASPSLVVMAYRSHAARTCVVFRLPLCVPSHPQSLQRYRNTHTLTGTQQVVCVWCGRGRNKAHTTNHTHHTHVSMRQPLVFKHDSGWIEIVTSGGVSG
jgi:hypothetical protein